MPQQEILDGCYMKRKLLSYFEKGDMPEAKTSSAATCVSFFGFTVAPYIFCKLNITLL
jgi:hypothetical protein